jgi:hypothetical protein
LGSERGENEVILRLAKTAIFSKKFSPKNQFFFQFFVLLSSAKMQIMGSTCSGIRTIKLLQPNMVS